MGNGQIFVAWIKFLELSDLSNTFYIKQIVALKGPITDSTFEHLSLNSNNFAGKDVAGTSSKLMH